MENEGYEIKVTGERVFESGSKRDPNADKGRYDLLSPMFIRRLAKHTQTGGKHRGDRNWEQGMPMSAVIDSTIRHLYDYIYGDRSEDHLAAAAWGTMNLIHHEDMIKRGLLPSELADLPDYTGIMHNQEELSPLVKLVDSGYCPNHGEYDTLKHENCPGCLRVGEDAGGTDGSAEPDANAGFEKPIGIDNAGIDLPSDPMGHAPLYPEGC